VDNWSGASLLPSLFQSLRTTPRKFTFLFIGFSDEEKGLVGSKSYAKQLSKEDKTRIRALINIDSLGLSSSKVWASRADRLLLSALGRAAVAMNLPITGMNVEKVGDSDSRAFADKHIPVIDIHSITQETLPILHTPRDSLAAIHMDDYYSSYRLITAYLSLLDTVLEDNGTEGTSSSAQLEQIRQ
jgi:Zn-dependent M28 family amino/carboxypeptidase